MKIDFDKEELDMLQAALEELEHYHEKEATKLQTLRFKLYKHKSKQNFVQRLKDSFS